MIVYRLLTLGTIEEKIYKRQIYKKSMSLATIDNGGSAQSDFDKYFGTSDLFELFQYEHDSCDTMQMLLKRDGFPIVPTPTNDRHVAFLKSLENLVKGLSLNSNLYTSNEEANSDRKELGGKLGALKSRLNSVAAGKEPGEKSTVVGIKGLKVGKRLKK